MPKIYPFNHYDGIIRPLREDLWFKAHQHLLLKIANTKDGRDLLCIDQNLPPLYEIGKNFCRGLIGEFTSISDFRVGAKWANVVRYRWKDFQKMAKWYYTHGKWTEVELYGARLLAATTSTFYPDPDPESTSFDGLAWRSGVDETWATLIAAAGTASDDSSAAMNVINIKSSATTNQWSTLQRAIYLFDTSSIPDTDTIDSATFSIYGFAKDDNLSITPDINVYASTPASNTAIANGDFSNTGSTPFSDSAITYAGWSITGYNDFTLNSSGLAAISKTGISKFSARNANYDVAASAPGSWSASVFSRLRGQYADTTGTSQDTKLFVMHTAGGNVFFMGANF